MRSGNEPPATADGKGGRSTTIRRRRRAVTDADGLTIRDRKMLELRILDGLDDAIISKVFGLGECSVRDEIRRARVAIG